MDRALKQRGSPMRMIAASMSAVGFLTLLPIAAASASGGSFSGNRLITQGIIKAAVVYDDTASEILEKKVDNRKELSESDKTAKARILSLLPKGKQSGQLHETPDIIIEYVRAPDVFIVEIK